MRRFHPRTKALPQTIALALACAAASVAQAGSVLFVDDDALVAGDGLSWETAYRFLKDGLDFASEPANGVNEIRVAQGTYLPDRSEDNPNGTGNQNTTFALFSNLTVQGGYAGLGAEDPDALDVLQHVTVLSGDLADDDAPNFGNRDDNSMHVVAVDDANVVVLGGFHIRGGAASGANSPADRGGGFLVDASFVIIRECTFTDSFAFDRGGGLALINGAFVIEASDCSFVGNWGTWGGGISVETSSLTADRCLIADSTATNFGGGVFISDGGVANIHTSTFVDNVAKSGGGIGVQQGFVGIVDCVFRSNTTEDDGGGGALWALESGLEASNCVFTNNHIEVDGAGGAIYMDNTECTLDECLFVSNRADSGGAVAKDATPGVITNCAFAFNIAQNSGAVSSDGAAALHECIFIGNEAFSGSTGALRLAGLSNEIADCVFVDNTATELVGALWVSEESQVVRCAFLANRAEHGGAVALGDTPRFEACLFVANSATEVGGSVYADGSEDEPEFVNCVFWANHCDGDGGVFYNEDRASPKLINCTLAYNTAGGFGAGLFNDNGEQLLANCILWGNSDATGTGEIAQIIGGLPTVSHCDIQGLTGNLGGLGNIDEDPGFVLPETGSLRLLPVSPCIESGDNGALPRDVTEDFDGNDRLADADGNQIPRVDMGAFEWAFRDCDRNGQDDGVDIAVGKAGDCNGNGVPDECDFADGVAADCNANGIPDSCDIADGSSLDCNLNGVPDECDLADGLDTDCNGNGLLDQCDFGLGLSVDCNHNGIPDECDGDCNGNGRADECDIADATSFDCNENGVPDECETDCNGNGIADECEIADDCNDNGVLDICEDDCNRNGVADECDIADGTSNDFNDNGIPDECEGDCNGNGLPDFIDIAIGFSEDCNDNGVPDECDLADGTSVDFNENGIPDECEADCNGNGIPDFLDIRFGVSEDCDVNGIPDECELDCNGNGIGDACDIADGFSTDCDVNGVPDECDEDCNGNGISDACDVLSQFHAESAELSPFAFDSPQEFLVQDPPPAAGDVTVTLVASAHLNQPERRVDIEINGVFVGQAFVVGAAQCPEEPEVDEITITAALFALIVDGGDALVAAIPSDDVDDCDGSFVIIGLDYPVEPHSEDHNGNGVPDECEVLGDLDGDGDVDGSDLIILIGAWGFCADCFDCPIDLDSDCIVGATDMLILLGNWGK